MNTSFKAICGGWGLYSDFENKAFLSPAVGHALAIFIFTLSLKISMLLSSLLQFLCLSVFEFLLVLSSSSLISALHPHQAQWSAVLWTDSLLTLFPYSLPWPTEHSGYSGISFTPSRNRSMLNNLGHLALGHSWFYWPTDITLTLFLWPTVPSTFPLTTSALWAAQKLVRVSVSDSHSETVLRFRFTCS